MDRETGRSPAKLTDSCGIVSYGFYVPSFRLDVAELAQQWELPAEVERAYRMLGRNSMAVNGLDEDAVTLAIAAAERALELTPVHVPKPASVLVGSESHPYAVKPSAVIVAEALGLTPEAFSADLEFACKAGSAAVVLSAGLVGSGQVDSALAVGADCPQSAPGSLLEVSVGAGAVAMVVGRDGFIARIDAVATACSDVTDFWRRDTAQFPSLVGKFSAEIGYLEHTCRVISRLLEATATRPEDYAYLCLHQPYQSLPFAAAAKMGFDRRQLRTGMFADRVGNTYSSACLLSLCAVLDVAEPGQRIMLASFGSGAGSDGLVLTASAGIDAFRERRVERGYESVAELLRDERGEFLPYGQYCLTQNKLRA